MPIHGYEDTHYFCTICGEPRGYHMRWCTHSNFPYTHRNRSEDKVGAEQKLLDDIEDAEDLVSRETRLEGFCALMIIIGFINIAVCVVVATLFSEPWATLPGIIGFCLVVSFGAVLGVHMWGTTYTDDSYRRHKADTPKHKLKTARRAYRDFIAKGGS